MSLVYPSNPLNAQDAKLIADNAILQLKKVATDAFLVSASTSIIAAATAGQFSLDLTTDPSALDMEEIVKQLSTVLGYTTTINNANTNVNVNWQSVARSKSTPDSNPDSNFGFEAN